MNRVLFLLSLVCLMNLSVMAGETIPADDAQIEYTGRIDFSDPLAPQFSFSGVSVLASFTGTSIAAILDDDQGENYYNVILDGVVIDVLHVTTGEQTYLLAEGLEDAAHEIELFKRTELTFGITTFSGFIVDDGEGLVEISNAREHFIEFIGNSITCGYGNEGSLDESFGPTTENHYLSYAAITSRNFNARHMVVSRSGIGIYRNYNGPAEGNADCMPNLYSRIFMYDDESPLYGFEPQPDVVCINLGTNDYSTTGGDSALYVSNYLRLIDTLQTRYDMPTIVCLAGPMLSGASLVEVKENIQVVIDSANKKGMGDVSFFEMSAQGSLGFGCDYHPTVAQHYKNAGELTAYLKTLMGWKVHPRVKSAKTISSQHVKLDFNTNLLDPEELYSGFTLYNESGTYTIDKAYRDTTKASVVNILIEGEMTHEDIIFLSYSAGVVESEDTVAMSGITGFTVENTLVAPDLVKTLEEDRNTASIKLFPNPNTNGVLQYNISGISEINKEFSYAIHDIAGAAMLEGCLADPSGAIDLPEFADGLYVIQVALSEGVLIESFVLARN